MLKYQHLERCLISWRAMQDSNLRPSHKTLKFQRLFV
nr:MAG TPA: hypothetical protein [Caudoviricetes sp.]